MTHSITYPAYLPSPMGVGELTKTEMEVFKNIDLLDKEIADILHISYHTVRSHTKNIRIKTGFRCKADMLKYAMRNGLIN